MVPVMVVLPAAKVSVPISIEPKPEVMEPLLRTPTLVKEEPVMPLPKVELSNTRVLLMEKIPPVARLRLPEVRSIPPEKVEVALLPTIVVVADPPI